MKKNDIITIFVTYIVGAVVGAYLYIYGFIPQYSEVTNFTEEVGTFDLVVRQYGECTASVTCSSYKVEADGSYRMLVPSGDPAEAPEVYEGKISSGLLKELRNTFTKNNLQAYSRPISPQSCSALDSGGNEYKLEINLNGTLYAIDTCYTAFANNVAALQVFEKLSIEI